MNKCTSAKRAAILRALCEGNSVRATARLTGAAKATVLKLLVEVGEFCSDYQDITIRNLQTSRVESDEIWTFAGAKAKNATQAREGDCWTYTAVDAESKLMISWLVGTRNSANTRAFIVDVVERLGNRVQLTTDSPSRYVAAVENTFHWNGVDFAQLIQNDGVPVEQGPGRKTSQLESNGAIDENPVLESYPTWYIERTHPSRRIETRCFTRLTNELSKKAENHAHAVSLFFMFYNFCKPRGTLADAAKGKKQTPAMLAGIADHVWAVDEIIAKMDPKFLRR